MLKNETNLKPESTKDFFKKIIIEGFKQGLPDDCYFDFLHHKYDTDGNLDFTKLNNLIGQSYFIMFNKGNLHKQLFKTKLYILTNDMSLYNKLDTTVDDLKQNYKFDSEHVTDDNHPLRSRDFKFRDHIVSIELNKNNLIFLKNLFPSENEHYNFFENILLYIEDKMKSLSTVDEIQTFFKSTTKDEILILRPPPFDYTSLDQQEIKILLYDPQIDTHVKHIRDIKGLIQYLTKMTLIASETELKTLIRLFGGSNINSESIRGTNKYRITIDYAYVNEIGHVVKHAAMNFLEENIDANHLLIFQINKNIKRAQAIYQNYQDRVDKRVSAFYQQRFQQSSETIVLTFCGNFEPEFSIQQPLIIPFYQCKSGFLLHDQLQNGYKEIIKNYINNTELFSEIDFFISHDVILRDTQFYNRDNYHQMFQHSEKSEEIYCDISKMDHKIVKMYYEKGCKTIENHGKKYLIIPSEKIDVSQAWEYGLKTEFIPPEFFQAYQHQAHLDPYLRGFIVMPVINLTLYYLFQLIDNKNLDTKIVETAKLKAFELINQYQLILPKSYWEIFKKSQHFTASEWQNMISRYQNMYESQIDLSKQRLKYTKENESILVMDLTEGGSLFANPLKRPRETKHPRPEDTYPKKIGKSGRSEQS